MCIRDRVISIIDPRSAVACLMQRTRDNGVMRGQISNSDSSAACYVYYLPNVNSISPGDVVVTSGTDSLYPKGLKIGSVTALSLDAGSEGTYLSLIHIYLRSEQRRPAGLRRRLCAGRRRAGGHHRLLRRWPPRL